MLVASAHEMTGDTAGGTEDVLRAFIGSFQTDASAMLGAFAPLRMAPAIRNAALHALQVAVKVGKCLKPCQCAC